MHKAFLICSTERSGHHSVIFWLAHQHNSLSTYQEVVNNSGTHFYDYDNYQVLWCDNLDSSDKYACAYGYDKIPIDNTKDQMTILATERDTYNNLKLHKFLDLDLILKDTKLQVIIALRDFRNTIASFMKNSNDFVPNIQNRASIWLSHAKEILTKKHYFINYNQYNSNINYRKQVCQDLNLDFTDIGLDYITKQGDGSSFTKLSKDNFDRSQLNYRYKIYENHNMYKQYMKQYAECLELSKEIFNHD